MACTRRCIVTLVAFVWLFTTVRFQMCPQIACPKGCIVTLVAFVWFVSIVRFQMCPQMACLRRGKVTLVAFVWLFSTVYFQMCPQMARIRRCIVTLVTFVWFNDIARCFLHDCHICILQTKVIIFKIATVRCVLSKWLLQTESNWVLVSTNYNCLVFHGILSLFHNWTANV